MPKVNRFEIRGRTFEVPRLGLDEAFASLEASQAVIGVANGQIPFSKLPGLLKTFARDAKVCRAPDGTFDGAAAKGAPLVALTAFLDDVFDGEMGLAFDFVVKCVELEHGVFLDGLKAAAAKAAAPPSQG